MNVLVLAAGDIVTGAADGNYPLSLAEINGVPVIQKIIESHASISRIPSRFIVCIRSQDARRFHLDNVVRLLSPDARIVSIRQDTGGAACTALLAAEHIDTDDELLILNGNELIDCDAQAVLEDFRARGLDAGCITFRSVHPRYSYVRLDASGHVVEAAEKNPISRNATAGFYWFRHGRRFVESAMSMIRKGAAVGNVFYICPSLNEAVLSGARVGTYEIDAERYHPLKSERHLQNYESLVGKGRQG